MKTADLYNRISTHLNQLRIGSGRRISYIQHLPKVQSLIEMEAAKIAVEMYIGTTNKIPLSTLWRREIVLGLQSMGFDKEQIQEGLNHALTIFNEKV